MSQTITVNIKMFGAFRKHHPGVLPVEVPTGCLPADIKSMLARKLREINPAFNDDELMVKSVLADNQRILNADEAITTSLALAILPPVCGG